MTSSPQAPEGQATFSSAISAATGYRAWIVSTFSSFIGASVIEVGIGDGGFVEDLGARARYVGVDVDPDLIAAARRSHPGASFVTGDICDPSTVESLRPHAPDTVICCNVLEHLAADRRAVENMTRLLSPGGHLLLLVPAHQALFNDLDRLAGHLRRYRRSSLAQLVPAGAERLRLEYFNPLGGVGWWLNRFTSHSSLDDRAVNRQILLFDRFVLPLSRALNPLTKGFFGQSALCVARKR